MSLLIGMGICFIIFILIGFAGAILIALFKLLGDIFIGICSRLLKNYPKKFEDSSSSYTSNTGNYSMENPPESYLAGLKDIHINNVYYDPKSDCYYPDSRKH